MAKKQTQSALSKAVSGYSSGKKQTVIISVADPNSTPINELKKVASNLEGNKSYSESPLVKSILNVLNGESNDSIEKLSFDRDPTITNEFQALWYSKTRLLPDSVLKRIAIQDDLVAAIVAVRGNQMSAFGRPQPDRFSTGFKIEPKAGVLEGKTEEYKQEIQSRIEKARDNLSQCGRVAGWSDNERMTLSQFLYQQSRNAVVLGRFATEIVYVMEDGERKFHSFRPIDAGTIYKATPQTKAADQVRKQARLLLEQLKNEKFIPERMEHDEYAWVQVIEGRPVQAFTPEECVVHNVYPVTDIELAGYPITPIDTMIAAVTTHINIVTHNKLYFQAGRAARGMLIIRSEDVNPTVVATVRQQFNASINSVNNAHRMPVFGIGPADEITWAPIDNSSRDMEFQYLSDSNARTILSAFQMSPEEIPGYAHLSRGTNSQALSESNSEYKLEAHRDVGIRPLLSQFQDFLNGRIFPLIDKNLSDKCVIKLVGLDAETAEKESVRLQQDMVIHMDYDEVREKVEKEPLGADFGGKLPLNPTIWEYINSLFTVGQILEKFCGMKGAAQNPELNYRRDQYWFSQVQVQQANQQMQMQAQQQQAVQGAQGQPQQDPNKPPSGDGKQPEQSPEQGQDLTRSIDQLMGLLTKSEKQLSPSKRRVLAQQKKVVAETMSHWEKERDATLRNILDTVEHFAPKTAI